MDVKSFLNKITFSYIQPDEPAPIRWKSSKELNNINWPENHTMIRRHLLSLKDDPRASTYLVGGIVNEIVRQMSFDSNFLFLGMNPFIFGSAIVGNPDKKCIIVHPRIDKRELRKKLFPYYRDNHIICKHHPNYFTSIILTSMDKLGVIFCDYRDPGYWFKKTQNHFSEDVILIVPQINLDCVYESAVQYLRESPYEFEPLLYAKPNPETKRGTKRPHITYWNGLMILRRID